jgi:hypothetical protein
LCRDFELRLALVRVATGDKSVAATGLGGSTFKWLELW